MSDYFCDMWFGRTGARNRTIYFYLTTAKNSGTWYYVRTEIGLSKRGNCLLGPQSDDFRFRLLDTVTGCGDAFIPGKTKITWNAPRQNQPIRVGNNIGARTLANAHRTGIRWWRTQRILYCLPHIIIWTTAPQRSLILSWRRDVKVLSVNNSERLVYYSAYTYKIFNVPCT